MRRALPIALAAALAFPVASSAHATLQSTTPRFGKEVQRGPVLIRLHFDQHVRALPEAVKVLNGVGRNFAGTSSAHGTDVVASVRPLKLGVYTVRWQAVSADSHVVSGVWTFGVRVPAPSINDAYGAGGPTRTEDVVRWLWFLGIALTIGALGLRLIVLRGLAVPRELDRKIAVAAGIGAVVDTAVGDRGVLPAGGGCVAVAVRQVPLRGPIPDGGHPLRLGVRRDDARLRTRPGARLPGVASRP